MGPADVQFAEALNNLANVYSDWNKHQEAIPLYSRAVDVQRGVLGVSHRNVAITLRNLGINQQEIGQTAEALQAYQQALTILSTVLPRGHEDLVSLRRVINYLRGDRMQEVLASAVRRVRSIKLPRLARPGRRAAHKLRLLGDSGVVEQDEED